MTNDTSRQESMPAYLTDVQKRLTVVERRPNATDFKDLAYATVPTPALLPSSAQTPLGVQLLILSTGQLATNMASGWVLTALPGQVTSGGVGIQLLDNGLMRVGQRGLSGAAVSKPVVANTSVIATDRWWFVQGIVGIGNMTLLGAYPSPFLAGSPSQHHTIVQNGASFKASLAANDYSKFRQALEGNRVQGLMWGTAQAQPIAVRIGLSLTRAATFILTILNANGRSISKAISFPAGASVQTAMFPGDTASGFTAYDASPQLYFDLWLAAGTAWNNGNVANLATAWGVPAAGQQAAGCTNLWDRANQQANLCEAKMEIGTESTPSIVLPFTTELAACQRYAFYPGFEVPTSSYAFVGLGLATNATIVITNIGFPVTMRASPAIDLNQSAVASYAVFDRAGGQITATALQIDGAGTTRNTGGLITTVAGGLTTFRPYQTIKITGQVGNIGFTSDI